MKNLFLYLLISALFFVAGCSGSEKPDEQNLTEKTKQTETELKNADGVGQKASLEESNNKAQEPGELKTYKWEDEFCRYKATYDASKYTPEQLKNTHSLIQYLGLGAEAIAFEPSGIANINMDEITAEYNKKKKHLTELNIVDDPYWRSFLQNRIRELDDMYELNKITYEAYRNPEVLLNNRFSAKCKKYAEALNADDEKMLKAWRELHEEQKENNGDPEGLEKRFMEDYNSPEKLAHAKVNLMTFGWWNCANSQVNHIATTEETYDRYLGLFNEILEKDCDYP